MPNESTSPGSADGQLSSEAETKFLLAEFEALRELMEQGTSSADKRIEVLLTIGAGVGGGLALLSQIRVQTHTFLIIASTASFSLLIIGLFSLKEVIDRNIDVVDYIRAINTIREYFTEHSSILNELLLLPTYPKFPPYGYQSNRWTATAINSLACAAFVTTTYMLFELLTVPDTQTTYFAGAAFLATFGLQSLGGRMLHRRAEKLAREHGIDGREYGTAGRARAEIARCHDNKKDGKCKAKEPPSTPNN